MLTAEQEQRVLLYVRLGYAPSRIDMVLGLPKGSTKRVMLKMWREGLKV